MDPVMAFAAARRDRMNQSDKDLEPLVRKALEGWTAEGDWYAELLDAATVLWLEFFEDEAPNADPNVFIERYREMAGEALAQTAKPSSPPTNVEVARVTYWLSTATINNATYWGNRAHGGRGMRWVTMGDGSVRETHRRANGQIADSDGTFDIGGFDLRYPGEPVGPPEIWINCRCILVSARVEGALSMDAITADMAGVIADVDEDEFPHEEEGDGIHVDSGEDEMPVDELEDDEEEITEIPVHGVAAVEGRPTGDGRQFAVGSVEFGQMPQPIGFEFESSHGGDNSKVAVIGRVDEFFKVEKDGYVEVRFRGVIFPGKEYAGRAIDGIVDRSYGGLSVIVDSVALDVETTEADALSAEDGQIMTQTFSSARIRRFDMVPTPAYQEAYIALGPEFPDEMDEQALAACAACGEGEPVWDDEILGVDLSSLTEEEIAAYDALSPAEQNEFINERGLIYVASTYREVSPEERRKLAKEGKALPDGSFPIANVEDLRNAIQAIGRAGDPEAAKRLIKKRAKELGQEDLIPDEWMSTQASAAQATAYGVLAEGWSQDEAASRMREAGVPEDIITSVVIAAFAGDGGRITGPGKVVSFAPGTKDGPGWITHPIPTGRIRRYWTHGKGAAKIRWGAPGDFNRCRRQLAKYIVNPDWLAGACANMHKEVLGVWPGQEGGGRRAHATEATMTLTAAGIATKPAEAFKDPGFTGPTPITIDGDRIFGHLATWGVCHIGIQDTCVTAPHSTTGYAFFRTGVVVTDEGRIPVGQITMGTGHASIKANAKDAVAHYDNTGSVVADVVAGEDAFGIWVSGILRPGLTDDQVAALAAACLSGDWRRTANGLELVAALAVNVPGFPVPRTAVAASAFEGQESLVAAGVVERKETVTASVFPSAEEMAGFIRTAVDEYRAAEERDRRLAAVKPFIEKARAEHAARVAAYFTEEN